jgi:predicted  nucleic acid-binding Zn-ribbon protein
MTTTRQLYSLQELDLTLASIESQKAEAERELEQGIHLDEAEATLRIEGGRLQELETSYRLDKLEVDGLREKSLSLNDRLYSGAITHPRELEGLQKEVSNIQDLLQQRDAALQEMLLKVQESQARCTTLKEELSDVRTAWENRRAELNERIRQLVAEQESIVGQRSQLAATIEPMELRRYENLRKTKGGRAVAKVERGLCQACRMSLPTQQLQRVRAGRQVVLCSSCGRMLFIS